MKSVRFDEDLERKLDRAARTLDMSHSEFIRDAVARRCDEVIGETLKSRLAPVIGIVRSSGGRARHAGRVYQKSMAGKRKP